jgi:ascorbate-specific PTS system EIIC-type component UlaA
MKAIVDRVRREPALLVGLVMAILIALTEFGIEVTAGQQAAIVGVIIAIGAIIVRQAVTPNVSVGALEDDMTNTSGELVAGQASEIPTGDPVDVVPKDEYGAYDAGNLLVALAALVLILCGLVWLVRAL